MSPKYYTYGQNNEIDFLLEDGMEIIPVEVKSGEAVHAASFRKYLAGHNSAMGIRYSMRGYVEQEKIINIPLYLIGRTKELLIEE